MTSDNDVFTKYNVHSNTYEDFIDIKADVDFEMVFKNAFGKATKQRYVNLDGNTKSLKVVSRGEIVIIFTHNTFRSCYQQS